MATVAELLQQYGVTDPSQIGFRYVDIPDPTAGDNAGTAIGAEYFNKATGTAIPDALGNNQFLVVDKDTGQVKVQQGWNDSFFGGLTGRVGDILSNPGVQYIGTAALLGNLAAGNLGTLGGAAGAGAGTTSAEAAMNALLQEEIASGALGSAAMGGAMGPLTAEQLGASFAADMAAAGYPATAAAVGAGALSGLSASQIANLAKAGVSVAGLLGGGAALAGAGGSGGGTGTGATTSGSTNYSPEYYSQLQQYYNKYLPGQPADVVSPLAKWYESTFNKPVEGMLTPTQASAGIRMGGMTPATVKQVQQLTVADKARTYTDLLNAGLTDTQARNVVEAEMGVQTPTDWNYLQKAAEVQNVSTSKDPLVKAQEYNSLLTSGMTDAQIRSLVEAAVGPQTDTDWKYLQQLASR